MFSFVAFVVYEPRWGSWFGILSHNGEIEDVVSLGHGEQLSLYMRDPWNRLFEGLAIDGWEDEAAKWLDLSSGVRGRVIFQSRMPVNVLYTKPVDTDDTGPHSITH